jgi:neutral ceramidase
MFDFRQGANSSNPLWPFIANLLHKSTPAELRCQEPKDILLPTGHIKVPHPWAPDVLPLQLLKLGQLVIVVVPTEMTTMAGRRTREQLKSELVKQGVVAADAILVIAGTSFLHHNPRYNIFAVCLLANPFCPT